MNPKKNIKKVYNKAMSVFTNDKDNKIIQFKKDIWQTDEISRSFVKGSDANMVVAADMMDKEVNEFFLANCLTSGLVLDIGCGHGIVSEYLAERGIHMAAIDISEKLLNELRTRIAGRNLPIEIKQGDAYNIPYADNTFDKVVARMFLPHFPNWPVVLKEMSRVTKKEGKILVHFTSAENTALGKQLKVQDCDFASSPDTATNASEFYAEAGDAEMQKACRAAGLELVNKTPVSFFLHNRLIGYQLGTAAHNAYLEKVQEFFKDRNVRDFAIWFDKEIISKCSPALSYFNIITFKKKK